MSFPFRNALVLLLVLSASAAEAADTTWWQRETAMTAQGELTFAQKPWWPRAQTLKEGERFTLDLNQDGRPDTIVTRMEGDIVEAIDDTGHAEEIWNKVNTTYVVSYAGAGPVDRMVSYLGDRQDGHAREMEIRYFRGGHLRYAWFARSYGGDAAKIFAMKHWQYAGNDQGSQFRGNAQIYLNKYDVVRNAWAPLSECPFSFWDLDGDGRTDVTLRVSAAPRGSLHGPDTDYANNYDYMWAAEATPLEKMGVLNLRLSFNVDEHPRRDAADQPHSNFSFTMTGEAPYQYAGMRDFNPARRAPQTTIHIPWQQKWDAALHYRATATGFTWDEARSNFRWEGQFWIYERAYLSNTGSPTHRWNMRREYASRPSTSRAMYFSPADSRFHLKGADEAWLEAGHLVSDEKDLEFRWWDSDGDGYLDTVEVYRANEATPARVAHFHPRPSPVAPVQATIAATYRRTVLPRAVAEDNTFIALLKARVSDTRAARYEDEATRSDDLERKRYCLDIARELYFLRLRDAIVASEGARQYPSGTVNEKRFRDPAPGSATGGYTLGDTLRFWSAARVLRQLDAAYADADLQAFAATLKQIQPSQEPHAQGQ